MKQGSCCIKHAGESTVGAVSAATGAMHETQGFGLWQLPRDASTGVEKRKLQAWWIGGKKVVSIPGPDGGKTAAAGLEGRLGIR